MIVLDISTNAWEVVGVDLNASKNFMKLSDGHSIGISRSLMNSANRIQKDFSNPNPGNKQTEKKRKHRIEKFQKNEEYHTERKIQELIDYVEAKGYKHIVLEDINGLGSAGQGNWAGWFGLEELKNEIKQRTNIPISLVHPQYTSQTCPRCHFVSAKNRDTRDTFHCKRCGFHKDADVVAAINIKNRITEPFLRNELETITPNGYVPKEEIKAQNIFDTYVKLHEIKEKEYKKKKEKKQNGNQ